MTKAAKVKVGAMMVALFIGALALGFLIRTNTNASEREEAATVYNNQLVACLTRGNEIREDMFALARIAANARAPGVSAEGHVILDRMRTAEFANPDGTINCQEAIEHP